MRSVRPCPVSDSLATALLHPYGEEAAWDRRGFVVAGSPEREPGQRSPPVALAPGEAGTLVLERCATLRAPIRGCVHVRPGTIRCAQHPWRPRRLRGCGVAYGAARARRVCTFMRLFDLAYCCRLYAEGTGYDVALAHFLEGTGGAVDLDDAGHRAMTLQWLRDWGCRSLRREDDARSSEALRGWWEEWGDALPAVGVTLDSLDDGRLDAASHAYGSLAQAIGPRRQLPDRLIDVRFGPTTAAKAMYAVRPDAFLPWDDKIRKKLAYGEDAQSYRRALVRARRSWKKRFKRRASSLTLCLRSSGARDQRRPSWSMSTIGSGTRSATNRPRAPSLNVGWVGCNCGTRSCGSDRGRCSGRDSDLDRARALDHS
jgi:hypothetical protein